MRSLVSNPSSGILGQPSEDARCPTTRPIPLVGFGAGLVSLWRDAEGAKKNLESANGQLADVKKLPETARDEAIGLKGVAEKAQAAEEALRKRLEVIEYGRTIQIAHQEWRENNVAGAVLLLGGTKPALRGCEWHYVHSLCLSELLTLKGHPDGVTSASFSPDGSRIVTASLDKTAKVWDANTGAELLDLQGHAEWVVSASLSLNGSRIATGSADKTARVWDARPFRDTRPPDPELAPPPRAVTR